MTSDELLYRCIVELEYVQLFGSGLCVSSNGKDLIREGMEHLGVKQLEWPTLPQQRKAEGSR